MFLLSSEQTFLLSLIIILLSVCRKSLERKSSQEKRERERDREHADEKRKEKEKPIKEESIKRPEKDIKKAEPVNIKKPDLSVSPKKLQSATLPVTRHRVSLRQSFVLYL